MSTPAILAIFYNLSLTLFKLGIFLVYHIQASLAPHNFAVGTTLFNWCSYLHCLKYWV